MRLLKILTVFIAFLLIAPRAFAQDAIQTFQEDPPTFSIGFSLGFPSSYHASILDVAGVQGLRVRGNIGGFFFILALYLQADINVEYHFAPPRDFGFYIGAGVATFRTSIISEFPNPDNGAWRLGGANLSGFRFGFFVSRGWDCAIVHWCNQWCLGTTTHCYWV
jgi:hypothetical protein